MSTALPQLPSNPSEDRGPALKAASISLCAIATLFVIIRLNVRAFITKVVSWDDWLILAATASNIATIALTVLAIDNGLGKHIGDIPIPMMIKALYWVFIVQSMFTVTQVLTKTSVGLTLLRIAVEKRYRITIYATMGFMFSYLTVILFVFNLNCKDVRANWDPTVPRDCLPQKVVANITYVIGSCNILTDLLCAIIIPFPMIWNLNTNKRTKASAMFVISLGAFACAASIARMPYLVNFGKTLDTTWDMAPVGLWSVVETEVAIIASCIPSFRPLFRSILETSIVISVTRQPRSSNNGRSTPGTHPSYPNSKSFTQISERSIKGDEFESDGTSERGLVDQCPEAGVPLGSIQKTTSSSIFSVQDTSKNASYSERTYTWNAGRAAR